MNKPHMMFQSEIAESLANGAAMMEEMVRGSLAHKEMPPRDVFEWFVKHATYRFVATEFAVAHGETAAEEDHKEFALEVQMLRDICANQGMFGLQTAINDILRQRTMHLPPHFTPLLKA